MSKLSSAGSKDTVLMAISLGPSINYTSYKKDAIAGYILYSFIDNAAGRGGGVRSGTIGGEVKPTSGSSTIFIEGKALVREGDTCTMNNGNVTGKYVTVDAS